MARTKGGDIYVTGDPKKKKPAAIVHDDGSVTTLSPDQTYVPPSGYTDPGATPSSTTSGPAEPPPPTPYESLLSLRASRKEQDREKKSKERGEKKSDPARLSAVENIAKLPNFLKDLPDKGRGTDRRTSARVKRQATPQAKVRREINEDFRASVPKKLTKQERSEQAFARAHGVSAAKPVTQRDFKGQRDRDSVVAQVSRENWSQAEKDNLGVTQGMRNPWEGVKPGSDRERRVLRDMYRKGEREYLFPAELQAKEDAKFVNLAGEFIPDTPVEQALTVAGGVGLVAKGLKTGKRVKETVETAEEAGDSINKVQAAVKLGKETRTGRAVSKVRKAAKSPAGRAAHAGVAAGTVGAAQATGNLQPIVEGTLQADVGDSAEATARNLLAIPAAAAALAGNTALSATRLAELPFNDDPNKNVDTATAPVRRLAAENIEEAKDMYETFTSKDPERIAEATEDDYGYLPVGGAVNLLRLPATSALRGATKPAVQVARNVADDRYRNKSNLAPRPKGENATQPVFPRVANLKENAASKVRVARESALRNVTENIALGPLEKSAREANTGAGKVVNRELDRVREELAAEHKGVDIPVAQQDLAIYLGSEARFSTRDRNEALGQIALREQELDANNVRADAPERMQLAALKRVPYLLERPVEKGTPEYKRMNARERRENQAREKFWAIADDYRRAADITPGVKREINPLEVADAAAVNTLDPDANMKTPRQQLTERKEAQARELKAEGNEVRAEQRRNVTRRREIAELEGEVKQMRAHEKTRMKLGRKPSKRLRAKEAKLAALKQEFTDSQANIKARGEDIARRKANLAVQLTASEKRAIARNLPDDATPAQRRAAFAEARLRKMEAVEAAETAPLRNQFERDMEAAMEKYGIERSTFIRNVSPKERRGLQGAPPFPRIGTAKDKERTGALRDQGEVMYDFKAAVETISRAAKRESDARIAQAMVDNARREDFGNGKQQKFTPDQIARLTTEGKFRPDRDVKVRASLFDSEENRSKVLDAENPAAVLRSMIDADNPSAFPTRKERLAQQIEGEGQGERFYVMDKRQVDYTLRSMEALTGFFRWLNRANGVASRLVLNTSLSWMVAQPIAEMFVLLMTHPNPVRLVKAMRLVAKSADDPLLARSLGKGADAVATRQTIGSDAKQYQGSTHDMTKAMNETPLKVIAKSIGSLDAPAYIDRKKGAWIRKVGYAAEVDRELNSKVRQFAKAWSGTVDEIDKISDKLRHLSKRDQIVWLENTPEGRRAAEQMHKNLDDMLGNWTALGPTEKEIAQLVFFYPFVRYSLNWTLRTFPKRHPIRFMIANWMAAWNAEQLEDFLTREPSFFTGWAQVPIYGDMEGAPVSFSPFQRATPSGNVLVEMLGDADSLADLSKVLSPSIGIPLKAMFNYDSFGNPIENEDFEFVTDKGLGGAAKEAAGNLVDQVTDLSFPSRYAKRLAGGEPSIYDEAPTNIFGQDVDTYGLRSGAFPFLPKKAADAQREAEVGRKYQQIFDAKKTADAAKLPDKLEERGKAVLDREKEQAEKFGFGGKKRSAADKRAVKAYLKSEAEKAYAGELEFSAIRDLVKIYKENGTPLPRENGKLKWPFNTYAEERQAERKEWADDKPDLVSPSTRDRRPYDLYYRPSTRIRDGVPEKSADFVGVKFNSKKAGENGSWGWSVIGGLKPWKDVTPDDIERGVKEAVLTREPGSVKATRKQQIRLANKILDAKERMSGGIKGLSSPGYDKFVNALSREVKGALSPKVLAAWTTQEGGNTSYGDWNLLNIGQADSGPYGPANEAEKWSDPETAAKWTAEFLKGNFGGPSESIAQILENARGKSDLEQIAVIANTDWAGDPNYQENITRNYEGLDVKNLPAGPKAKARFLQLVERGKAMGVYGVPGKQAKIKTFPGAGEGRGDWSGMEYILEKAGKGIDISSRKRSASDPLSISNPGSDHNEANTTAYALDLPATGEAGREIAETMHKRLGLKEPLAIGTYNWYTSSKYPNTRYQVLWEVEGHYDHVHVGGEDLDPGGVLLSSATSPMALVKDERYGSDGTDMASTSTSSATTGTTTVPGTTGTGTVPTQSDGSQRNENAGPTKYETLMNLRSERETDNTDEGLYDLSAVAEIVKKLPKPR